MHVTAVLNKSFSQSVGGTGVGGYLQTALANKNGELVFPVIITGTMNHPLVAPDVQQIAKMRMNNLLPTAGGLLSGKGGNLWDRWWVERWAASRRSSPESLRRSSSKQSDRRRAERNPGRQEAVARVLKGHSFSCAAESLLYLSTRASLARKGSALRVFQKPAQAVLQLQQIGGRRSLTALPPES